MTVFPLQGSHPKILRYVGQMGGLWEAYGRPMGLHVQSVQFETKADCGVIMVNGEVWNKVLKEKVLGDIN